MFYTVEVEAGDVETFVFDGFYYFNILFQGVDGGLELACLFVEELIEGFDGGDVESVRRTGGRAGAGAIEVPIDCDEPAIVKSIISRW